MAVEFDIDQNVQRMFYVRPNKVIVDCRTEKIIYKPYGSAQMLRVPTFIENMFNCKKIRNSWDPNPQKLIFDNVEYRYVYTNPVSLQTMDGYIIEYNCTTKNIRYIIRTPINNKDPNPNGWWTENYDDAIKVLQDDNFWTKIDINK